MEVLTKGSVESLLIPVRDRLNNIEDLATVTDLKFDTKKKVDASVVQANVAAVLDADWPMTAICQIDTTLAGYVAGNVYHLYLKYTAGTESPILGPVPFRVEAD